MDRTVRKTFEAWQSAEDVAFGTAASMADQRSRGLLGSDAVQLYSIEAGTWEEAMAIHHLRMGFEPYRAQGQPVPCAACSALLYPEGSGECWRCGFVQHGG